MRSRIGREIGILFKSSVDAADAPAAEVVAVWPGIVSTNILKRKGVAMVTPFPASMSNTDRITR